MNINIYKAAILLSFLFIGCDDANDLLNQYIKEGPIVYAGKIEEMDIQSGYYRVRVNLFPAEDINRSHCILSWNVSTGIRDSIKVKYTEAEYDEDLKCYYTFIDLPSVEGNLLIESQNVDLFGNRSLINNEGAYIYGSEYVSTLLNSPVRLSLDTDEIIFENRVGVVDNLLSYEQSDGRFTEEVPVKTERHLLIDAKSGGIIRSKTRYLMNEMDIDTLVTTEYLETSIP